MNDSVISTLVDGVDDSLSVAARQKLDQSVRTINTMLTTAKTNRTTKAALNRITTNGDSKNPIKLTGNLSDTEVYTNLSELINNNNKVSGNFSTILENLYMKNKRYFSIIKDYELMPILIPQINRVLMFLVNECLSPDIQNEQTFTLKLEQSIPDNKNIQDEIDKIKKDTKLDNTLRDVYMNRFKLGKEYYRVIDYNTTYDHMLTMINKKQLNEAASSLSDSEYIDAKFKPLTETISAISCKLRLQTIKDRDSIKREKGYSINESKNTDINTDIIEETVNLNFSDMNIVIEKSPAIQLIKEAHEQLLAESYNNYTIESIFDKIDSDRLNEAVLDTENLKSIIDSMKRKRLQRCTIERLDPAKTFQLKIGGKKIAYLYISDINENSNNIVNFSQSLKDQLLKNRVTNLQISSRSAEEVISKDLAEKIINKFDSNIGINRIEDIDLLHDFILNNELYNGNKRITFYYPDEIFDLSRTDGSIMTNAVLFTKLYSTLMINNIITKVLRGRGRQIHTVKMGVSPSVQRYVENAMASLSMPESNLATLHGSFEQILNPFNSSSDIIIPTEDNDERFITTDYIPGQDVDMDDEFLKMLMNAIISSFGLDAAILDTTNGNIQFATTLSMESLQISTMITNEQQDNHNEWERLCLRVLSIMGSDNLKTAVSNKKIKMHFFEPKSLILTNTNNEINNAKQYAESIADIIPKFNEDGMETLRNMFVYSMVKDKVNIDWTLVETRMKEIGIEAIDNELLKEIREVVQKYKENTKQQAYGDKTNDGIVSDDDLTDTSGKDSDLDDIDDLI